jgi:hypothetical protein
MAAVEVGDDTSGWRRPVGLRMGRDAASMDPLLRARAPAEERDGEARRIG